MVPNMYNMRLMITICLNYYLKFLISKTGPPATARPHAFFCVFRLQLYSLCCTNAACPIVNANTRTYYTLV